MKIINLVKSSRRLLGRSSVINLCRHIASQGNTQHHKVLVSKSLNIYENLALEDWLYENTDFNKETILLLWHNSPCVVFGRHQNPWIECNVPYCEKFGVDLVRRKSGGGTVYHDEGNLNCSFMMKQSLYNRRRNLQLVVDALTYKWNTPLSINDRDDILLLDKYKISGTASKLGRNKTYHHFTLLYNVDTLRLKSILHSNLDGTISNATRSIPAPVMNLVDLVPDIDFSSLVNVISERFVEDTESSVVEYVDPADKSAFPGINKHLAELKAWNWIFAKTPPFSISRTFQNEFSRTITFLEVSLDVTKGKIHNLDLKVTPPTMIDSKVFIALSVGMEETQFTLNEISKKLSSVKMEWITSRLYTVETHAILDWTLLCIIETVALHHGRTPSQNTDNNSEKTYLNNNESQATW
ncbi:Lipoyltransferase 1 [Mactra antiquata]